MKTHLNPILAAALVLCSLFLVNAQYQARRLFIELERAQAKSRQLEIEWAQLQVEQSRLGQHARIEAGARQDLNMVAVTPARTQYLTLEAK
ncbi:MAG: cell division protein FtsL [Burkholderiaceae bacterium]|nr:cell division protein FtsL [Burkholderiaceae bacterium]